jgi:uncharacterized protein YcnI
MKTNRFILSLVGGSTLVVLAAAPAWAHLDPDPVAAQKGTTTTISFTVAHGCGDSPTTSVKIQIPAGVTNVEPQKVSGFTESVADGAITYSGGSLAAHTELPFPVKMTLPATAGPVSFPAIQKCVSGEIDWIEVTKDGQPEPEHPAPMVKITDAAPTAAELTAPTDAPEATTAETVAGASVTLAVTKSDSKAGPIVGGVVIIVGVIAAAVFFFRKKA